MDERDRETDRQTNTGTDRHRVRERDRVRERERGGGGRRQEVRGGKLGCYAYQSIRKNFTSKAYQEHFNVSTVFFFFFLFQNSALQHLGLIAKLKKDVFHALLQYQFQNKIN